MKIRSIVSVFTIFFNTVLFASCGNAQPPKGADTTSPFKKITYTEWKEEAKTDEQKDADRELIETYGLSIDPKNPGIITDKATVYLVNYQVNNDLSNLINAITLLEQSYSINPKNQNTLFKLSICWFLKNDCKKARKYYKECMDLGGKPITLEFTNALKEKCREN